jgi:hypothetical protein
MMDDIVTRLRNWPSYPKEQWASQNEAADEIERLRAEIEAQRVQINDLQFELKDLRKFRLEVLREAINCIPAIPSIAFSSTTQAGGRAR